MNKKNIFWALTILFSDTTMAYQQTKLASSAPSPSLIPWNTGPWSPRFVGQGLVGNAKQLAGSFDGMIPVAGTADFLWFADGSFLSGQNGNMGGSIGSGLRALKNLSGHETIMGGFLFADYQQSTHQTRKWIANPGVELLTRHQEVRIQGYVPIGSRAQTYSYTMASLVPHNVLADSGQSVNTIYKPTVHSLIDTPVALNNEFGRGIEAEAGQYLPIHKGSWLRAGVYHFDYPNAPSINGVEANYELFINKNTSLIVQDNYDNQNKNRFSLGLRMRLGGPDSTNVNQLSNRMEEPIIRHLARQSYGMETPVRQSYTITGPTQIVRDNLWFFSPTGSMPGAITWFSCTAENPCLNLNQTISSEINALSANATIWFATGTYNLPSQMVNSFALAPTSYLSQYVSMADGQSIAGRTFDFMQAAQGTERPLINGALYWNGTGQVSNIQITNNSQVLSSRLTALPQDAVIAVAGLSLTIDNSIINATSGDTNTYGVSTENDVVVTNSTVNAQSTGTAGSTYSIYSNQNALVSNSTLNANGLGDVVAGIQANTLTTTNSAITAHGANEVFGVSATASAVVNQNSTVSAAGLNSIAVNALSATVTDSILNATASSNGYGIQTENDVMVTNSTVNTQSTGSTGSTYSIYSNQNALVSNSTLNANGLGDVVAGIQANTLTTTNSAITAHGANEVFGVSAATTAVVNQNSTVSVEGLNSIAVTAQNASVTDTLLNVTASNSGYGVQTYSDGINPGTAVVVNSIMSVINTGSGTTEGVYSPNLATVTGTNMTITGNLSTGVEAGDSATVTNSSITATGQTVYGVLVNNSANVTNSSINISGNSSTGVQAGDSAVTNSSINATGQTVYGVLGNNSVNVTNSHLEVTSNATGDSIIGISGTSTNVANSTINATGETVYGVEGTIMTVSGSSIFVTSTNTVNTIGAAGINGLIGTTQATVNNSTIIVEGLQSANGTNIYGVRANLVSIDGTTVNLTTQAASSSNATGVFGINGVTITNNSQVTTTGHGAGVVYGTRSTSGSITIADSSIKGITTGTNSVYGVYDLTNSISISNSSIEADKNNASNTNNAIGINSAASHSVTFSGNQASTVTVTNNGTGTEIAIANATINNNSSPQSLCIVNGVSTTC